MTRHSPHRLRDQAYQLWPTIPLAVRFRNAAPTVKFWRDESRLPCGISRQDRASPISAPRQPSAGAQRWHHQNPKSP
jgi:hypothetical protein